MRLIGKKKLIKKNWSKRGQPLIPGGICIYNPNKVIFHIIDSVVYRQSSFSEIDLML